MGTRGRKVPIFNDLYIYRVYFSLLIFLLYLVLNVHTAAFINISSHSLLGSKSDMNE